MNFLFESQKSGAPVSVLSFPELQTVTLAAQAIDGEARREAVEELRAAEFEIAIEAAREQGRADGLAEGDRRRRADLEVERTAVSHLCTSFAKERKRYFAEVEGEVVKLALAIAARVLQREATLDPLLLKGVVTVALAKLGEAKGAVLRMAPEQVEAWRGAMKHSGLHVAADDAMMPDELRLEMHGAVAELGVAAQLVELERGFFDLMARRPA